MIVMRVPRKVKMKTTKNNFENERSNAVGMLLGSEHETESYVHGVHGVLGGQHFLWCELVA